MNKSSEIAKNITINLLRFALALVFAFSGFVKAVDPMGTVIKMTDYAEAFDVVVHPALLYVGTWLLIMVEYVMGVALFFGFYRRFYLSLMTLFLSVVTPLTLVMALTNPVSDCGCFGDALVLTNWQTFGKNVVLLLMTIVALVCHKRIGRVVSLRMQWLVFVCAVASIAFFMQYNTRHLPIWDFRPYAIGENIIDGMTMPDDAPGDEYETLFVLEKEGKQRSFTFDNYPDSTWTFVKRESRLVSRGYVPPMADFYLSSLDGEDMTSEVLERPGYTFLMVACNLKRANEGLLDVINDLHDYAKVGGHAFYMLTSSSMDAIEDWNEHTGATYACLNADEILLKTMIRANIGLIVLRDATIIGKWSAADLPLDGQLYATMEENGNLLISSREVLEKQVKALLWMFLPLLLLCLVDRFFGRKKPLEDIK